MSGLWRVLRERGASSEFEDSTGCLFHALHFVSHSRLDRRFKRLDSPGGRCRPLGLPLLVSFRKVSESTQDKWWFKPPGLTHYRRVCYDPNTSGFHFLQHTIPFWLGIAVRGVSVQSLFPLGGSGGWAVGLKLPNLPRLWRRFGQEQFKDHSRNGNSRQFKE